MTGRPRRGRTPLAAGLAAGDWLARPLLPRAPARPSLPREGGESRDFREPVRKGHKQNKPRAAWRGRAGARRAAPPAEPRPLGECGLRPGAAAGRRGGCGATRGRPLPGERGGGRRNASWRGERVATLCALGRRLWAAVRGVSAKLLGAQEKGMRVGVLPRGQERSGGDPPPPPLPSLARGVWLPVLRESSCARGESGFQSCGCGPNGWRGSTDVASERGERGCGGNEA